MTIAQKYGIIKQFVLVKLLCFLIVIAGASFSRAFEQGSRLLALRASTAISIALIVCLFDVDSIGFLKKYWLLLLILYAAEGIFIAMAEDFETVAEAITRAGEVILELVCPWMPV